MNNKNILSYIFGALSAIAFMLLLSYFSKKTNQTYVDILNCQQTSYISTKLSLDLLKNRMIYKKIHSSTDLVGRKKQLASLEMEENHLVIMIIDMYKDVGWLKETGLVDFNTYVKQCFINNAL
jgi:hypothetical protein